MRAGISGSGSKPAAEGSEARAPAADQFVLRPTWCVLMSAADTDLHQMAVISGASGIVMREHDPEVLVKAIQRVHAGELWLGRSLTTRLVTKLASSSVKKNDPEAVKIATLTKREKEVVMLVGKGLNSTIIAEQLGISEATVRNHLTSILDKLGVSNKFELAVYAFRNSLAGPSPAPAHADTLSQGRS